MRRRAHSSQSGKEAYIPTRSPLIGHRHLYLLVITHTASLPRPVFRPSVIKAPQPACTCKRPSAPLQARPPRSPLCVPSSWLPNPPPVPQQQGRCRGPARHGGAQLSPDGHLHGECSRRGLCLFSALPGTGLLRGKNTVQPVECPHRANTNCCWFRHKNAGMQKVGCSLWGPAPPTGPTRSQR